MADLAQQISKLDDIEAIGAAGYVAGWMKKETLKTQALPREALDEIRDDQAAIKILSEMFPELSDSLHEESSLSASERLRGQRARNFLLFLAENERYALKVHEAIDRPFPKGEPITTITVAAGILYLLSIEFEIEHEEIVGGQKRRWRLARKSPLSDLIEMIRRILGL